MSPCVVTLLASRKPVSSRFPVVYRGSSAESARQNQGEHLALSFLGRNFRSSPCKLSFRAKCESFVFDFWSEEYAIYIVLLEGILRALQLSIPSLRLLPIL